MAGRPKKKADIIEEGIKSETMINETLEKVKEEKPKRLSSRLRNSSNKLDFDRLDKNRKVPVLSVKGGTVGYKCKLSMQTLKWTQYGDEHMMSIGELLSMYSESKKYLTAPWLLVDDEEFAEVLNLKELYEAIFDSEDLERFYSAQLLKIKRKLEELPSGVRKELLNRTVMAINSGELNNLSVVKLLKQEYGIDVEI